MLAVVKFQDSLLLIRAFQGPYQNVIELKVEIRHGWRISVHAFNFFFSSSSHVDAFFFSIRKLKNELLEIKRKGPRPPRESAERQCARCIKTLGLIFDRGELCDECQLRVCSECRVSAPKRRQWRCNVCAKIS